MSIVYKGKSKKIFFSASNYYGADLKASVLDDDAGEFLVTAVPMIELIEPIAPNSTTTVGVNEKDSTLISVDSVNGFIKSDRVSIGGSIYRIINIDTVNNRLTLHIGLREDVIENTDVIRVGNMGIYKIHLVLTRNGYFVIQAKDTVYGIQRSDSITVKEESLEDLVSLTNIEINENERIIRETSSFTIII